MSKQLFSLILLALFAGFFAENIHAQASGVKPELIMYRHNGGTITPAPVVPTNILGTLKWNGLAAIGNIQTGAAIRSVAVGPVATNLLPSNMIFSTQGFAGLKDRMIITENGLVGVGELNPQFHLDILGNTHTSGDFFGRIHMDPNPGIGDAPNTYLQEAYFERKPSASMVPTAGLTNLTSDGGLLTLAPSLNGAGPLNTDHQLFFNEGGVFHRQEAANGAAWTAAWEKLLTSGDINGRPNLVARFLPPGPLSSKIGDSQLYDDGSNVVIGGIPAAPAAATPVFNASDMLTVNGNSRTTGNAVVDGNATVSGNLGIGKAPSTFDLDVAGESNFDGRVKIGASAFPTFAGASFYSLSVGGGILAEEVLVDLQPWADYVFEPDYELAPLAEVEQFIKAEKHLPGVASAKEIEANGLNLGEMQKTQMEKIEELYLHMIAMEKEMKSIKAENQSLKAKVEQLEKR